MKKSKSWRWICILKVGAFVLLVECTAYNGVKGLVFNTWATISKDTRQLLGFVYGKQDSKTFKKLHNQPNTSILRLFCRDYQKSYTDVIVISQRLQNKKQTFTIESYNSKIHRHLARFQQKTKCYPNTTR